MVFCVWGTRLMGSTDRVRQAKGGGNLFHVATKFQHFCFLPLIPSSTYVVLDFLGADDGDEKVVEIPLSRKSIGIAWLRFLSWIAVWVLSSADVDHSSWESWVRLASALVVAIFVTWHGYLNDASHERAIELCTQYIKLGTYDPTLRRLVDASFATEGATSGDGDLETPTQNESDLGMEGDLTGATASDIPAGPPPAKPPPMAEAHWEHADDGYRTKEKDLHASLIQTV